MTSMTNMTLATCWICNEGSETPSGNTEHMRTVHPQAINCTECRRGDNHICVCGANYTWHANLEKHVERVHRADDQIIEDLLALKDELREGGFT